MFDWTAHTKDPSDTAVAVKLQAFLTGLQVFFATTRNDFLREYFRGAHVLDIGAGEHNPSCYNEEKWEHGIICKVAAYAVGIEINAELCEHYNQKGYRFKCIDATSEIDLGERFDRVFMGDVIEHVNNPVALLQFAKRHLVAGGRILLTTPNPYYFAGIGTRSRKKNRPFFIANFEHTCWITPTNANELARRSGLQFTRIYFPQGSLKKRLLEALGLIENAHKEFMYEFTA